MLTIYYIISYRWCMYRTIQPVVESGTWAKEETMRLWW